MRLKSAVWLAIFFVSTIAVAEGKKAVVKIVDKKIAVKIMNEDAVYVLPEDLRLTRVTVGNNACLREIISSLTGYWPDTDDMLNHLGDRKLNGTTLVVKLGESQVNHSHYLSLRLFDDEQANKVLAEGSKGTSRSIDNNTDFCKVEKKDLFLLIQSAIAARKDHITEREKKIDHDKALEEKRLAALAALQFAAAAKKAAAQKAEALKKMGAQPKASQVNPDQKKSIREMDRQNELKPNDPNCAQQLMINNLK